VNTLACSLAFLALAAPALRPARLHTVVSRRVLGRVAASDATAALKVWGRQMGVQNGFDFDLRVDIADSMAAIRQRALDRSADLFIIDTLEYLMLGESSGLEPALCVGKLGRPALYEYLLLAPPGSEETLATMKGVRVAIASRTGTNGGLLWLETKLADLRLGRARNYFESAQVVERASLCVLPVFFGRLKGCVVSADEYEVMRELNPQLNRLRVVARSEPLMEGIMAMPNPPHTFKKELLAALLSATRQPGAEQVLMLFHSGPPVEIGPHSLDSMRELFRKYCRLNGSCAIPEAAVAVGGSN